MTVLPARGGRDTTFLASTRSAAARSVEAVTIGARTPEELDALLEDAFVLRDRAASEALFHPSAVLLEAHGSEARGDEAIGRTLEELWDRELVYVARPRHLLRTRALALVVADSGTHVVQRGADGAWRATLSLLELHPSTKEDA